MTQASEVMQSALRPYFDIADRGMNLEVTCACGQNWLIRKTPPQPDNLAWLLKHAGRCQAYKIVRVVQHV